MNLEENNNFFRESFKGFNKDDVAAFIAKLSKDYSENEDKYKEHIAKLTADNRAKAEEINKLNYELTSRGDYTGTSAPPEGYISPEQLEAIEQKYKDELDKLSAEIYEKDQMINNFMQSLKDVSASEKRYREEMNNLIDEINEKNDIIEELRKSASAPVSAPIPLITSEEIDSLKEKYKEVLLVNEELQRKIEENEKKLREAASINPDMANQLSAQLAISESEKLFLISLLKKIADSLGVASVIFENVTKTSQIPEYALQDIENKIAVLSQYKDKSSELEKERENFILEINDLKQRLELEKEKAERQQPVVMSASAPSEQKMYEAITAELGGVVYSAKKSAEEMVAKAKNESEDIINRANMKRLSILEDHERHLAGFREKYQAIKTEHETIVVKYKEMTERYTMRLSEIEESIDAICKNI